MIEKLIANLIEHPQTLSLQTILLTIAAIIAVKYKDILEFLGRKRKRREEVIKDALNSEAITGAARWAVEEEWNRLVFREVNGICADVVLREKIKELIQAAGGELQPGQFARARHFLRMTNGELSVKHDMFDTAEYVFNWVLAAFAGAGALFFILYPPFSSGLKAEHLVAFFVIGISLAIAGGFLVFQNLPMIVAKRIGPVIERLQSVSRG